MFLTLAKMGLLLGTEVRRRQRYRRHIHPVDRFAPNIKGHIKGLFGLRTRKAFVHRLFLL